MSLKNEIDGLLAEHGISPVLVDVGASGGAPEIWAPIAHHSRYIGFDPDLREIRRDTAGGYRAGIIVNKAVSPDTDAATVTFYLTESPYCSSMLRPDAAALSSQSFWRLFQVTREVQVPATTLDKVLSAEGIETMDWLKIDSQGADLRIYRSMHDATRSRLLALDTEPGLIDAYEGEDLFVEVHRHMRIEGFWLSNLNVMGVPRVSANVMEHLSSNETGLLDRVRNSPGWCEARYFRTADYLTDIRADERVFVLAWVFAIIDGQQGHALELALRLRSAGHARLSEQLTELAYRSLRTARPAATSISARVKRRLRRFLT